MGRRDKSRLYNFFVLLRTSNSPFLQLSLSPTLPFSNSPFSTLLTPDQSGGLITFTTSSAHPHDMVYPEPPCP